MADNRSYVYQRLRRELGLTPAQAAGAVGGLGGESGRTLDPNAVNPTSGALGIGQWLGGRARGVRKGDVRAQTSHLIAELRGPERAALSQLKSAHSIDDATSIFVRAFERPSASEIASSLPARIRYAREAFNRFGASGGGGRSSAPGGGSAGGVRTIPGRPGSTRTESTTTVIPGVDNRLARASLIQSFLDDHSSIDPLDFAVQARQLQDVAPSSTTETRTFRTPGTPGRTVRAPGGVTPLRASSFGAGNGPAGRRGPVAHMTSEGGPHATDGLAGFPARDYFAHPGSAAVAPINGRVVRLSGHDPANGPTQGPHGPLGWSVYIQGDDGHTYFLTHMGSRSVKPGQRVRAGQKIGTVANYDKYGTPSHIHMGVH